MRLDNKEIGVVIIGPASLAIAHRIFGYSLSNRLPESCILRYGALEVPSAKEVAKEFSVRRNFNSPPRPPVDPLNLLQIPSSFIPEPDVNSYFVRKPITLSYIKKFRRKKKIQKTNRKINRNK